MVLGGQNGSSLDEPFYIMMKSEWQKNCNFEESDIVEVLVKSIRYLKDLHKSNLDIDRPLCSWVFILKFETFCLAS